MGESILNTLVDHYLIQRRIKAGGVAVVYEAQDTRTNETVAFKILQSSWAEHDEVIYRFQREARIMAKLKHPHIIHFRDDGLFERRPYIVMDYLPGGSLADRLKQISQIHLKGSANLLTQISSALDYAHRRNVIHRDLKPGNILLENDELSVLTDFGIARILDHTKVTMTGNMPGTPHYMSPEQAKGLDELGPLSDLYSLAIIAYLLSTGSLPFTGTDPLVIINQHLSSPPPTPSEVNPNLPSALDTVLLKALSKKPEDRYPTAGDFSKAYSEAITGYEKVNVLLASRKTKENQAADFSTPSETGRIVFSDEAEPLEFENTSQQIAADSQAILQRGRSRNLIVGLVVIVIALVGIIGFLVINGGDRDRSSSLISPPIGPGANVAGGIIPPPTLTLTASPTSNFTQTAQAEDLLTQVFSTAVARDLTIIAQSATPTSTVTPSETPTHTPTLTHTATYTTTPTSTLTDTPTVTLTDTPTFTATYTDTPTSTLTDTPTVTYTDTPTNTATFTPTLRSTQTPGATRLPTDIPAPSPTPYEPTFSRLMDDFSNSGTGARFNCTTFVAAFDYLSEQLQDRDSQYEMARELIEDQESPIQIIYKDYCQNDLDNTAIFIEDDSLVPRMNLKIREILSGE